MQEATANLGQFVTTSKRFAQRILAAGENRLELLTVEVEEGRERVLQAIILGLGAAVFGLLAGVAFTLAIGVLFWPISPIAALLVLALLYAAGGWLFYQRLMKLLRDWKTLGATLDQLKKDCVCLAETLK